MSPVTIRDCQLSMLRNVGYYFKIFRTFDPEFVREIRKVSIKALKKT